MKRSIIQKRSQSAISFLGRLNIVSRKPRVCILKWYFSARPVTAVQIFSISGCRHSRIDQVCSEFVFRYKHDMFWHPWVISNMKINVTYNIYYLMTEFHSCYHIYSSQVIGHSTTIMFSTCIVLLYALKAHVELHIFL